MDALTKLIEDTVDTDSWKDNGGSTSSLREFVGILVVTTSSPTHQKIAALLAKLRSELSTAPALPIPR